MSPMAELFHLREQAERCCGLARDSTDPTLRASPLRVAEDYIARTAAQETGDPAAWQAASDDDGAA